MWNGKSETIRCFANSGFALGADKSDAAIIKPFKNADTSNQIEYIKETYQLKNHKTKKCLAVQPNESLKWGACKLNDDNQQFYPFYTYQVQGSYWHRLENE